MRQANGYNGQVVTSLTSMWWVSVVPEMSMWLVDR